jgi:hypothetical protein
MATPLSKAKNLGPVCVRELAQVDVHTLERLRELGWEEACLMWIERFPARINLNAFRGVIGAIHDVHWNAVPPEEDRVAQRMVKELRRAAKLKV